VRHDACNTGRGLWRETHPLARTLCVARHPAYAHKLTTCPCHGCDPACTTMQSSGTHLFRDIGGKAAAQGVHELFQEGNVAGPGRCHHGGHTLDRHGAARCDVRTQTFMRASVWGAAHYPPPPPLRGGGPSSTIRGPDWSKPPTDLGSRLGNGGWDWDWSLAHAGGFLRTDLGWPCSSPLLLWMGSGTVGVLGFMEGWGACRSALQRFLHSSGCRPPCEGSSAVRCAGRGAPALLLCV
jgi:hypothetical protein